MRVAIDAMLLGGAHSGVEVAVEGLCQGLRDVAGRHEFLIAHRSTYSSADLRSPALSTVQAPAWTRGRPGRILWERLWLPRVAANWGADVLHAPAYVLPCRWRGPAVLTVYDILAITHPEWCKPLNAAHFRRAIPRSVARADIIVVPSEVVRDELLSRLGVAPGKVRVVPLGIPPAMAPASLEAIAAARNALDLPERYLLCVGNIEPKKNLEGTVRAFELAASRIPHELVIAGRPAWKSRQALQAIAGSPLASRIRRLGYVPASLLPALCSGADLLVQWSMYEGAGLTPLEALACGTPAVVSDGGALPEIAGRRATVVPLGNPANLADAIVALVENGPERAETREESVAWARQFTWLRHAESMIALYEEAAGLGPRA